MSSEKDYSRRYNPLELSVEEYGAYIQRLPLCTSEALDAQFPKEYIVVKVLYHLVKRAANLTYLSGTYTIQEVEISTTELAMNINADQPNVYNALVKLQNQSWLQNNNKKKGAKGKYLVNFGMVIDAIREYHKLHKDNNKPQRKRERMKIQGMNLMNLLKVKNGGKLIVWSYKCYSLVL